MTQDRRSEKGEVLGRASASRVCSFKCVWCLSAKKGRLEEHRCLKGKIMSSVFIFIEIQLDIFKCVIGFPRRCQGYKDLFQM